MSSNSSAGVKVVSGQNYQARGPINRTALITVRVAPEQRELLHGLASERGETLSRMLLSPWLAANGSKPAKRAKKDAAVGVAVQPVVSIEPVAEAGGDQPLPERPVAKRRRAARVIPGQENLVFADVAGER